MACLPKTLFSKRAKVCPPPAARVASCSTPSHTWPARAWRRHKPGRTPRQGPHEARPRGARHSRQHQLRAQTFTSSMTLALPQTTLASHQTHHHTHTSSNSTRHTGSTNSAHQTSRRNSNQHTVHALDAIHKTAAQCKCSATTTLPSAPATTTALHLLGLMMTI